LPPRCWSRDFGQNASAGPAEESSGVAIADSSEEAVDLGRRCVGRLVLDEVAGVFGDAGLHVFRLPGRRKLSIQRSRTPEFLFTADWIGAQEVHRLGMVNHVVPRAELEAFGLSMAERIAQKPLFALKLVKQAVNAAQDAQGRLSAMQTSFALHHLAHAHNMLAHGKLVDPTGLMPAIKKHQKAAE
jgi:Enoyl-CoA hydratase/isomerase